MRKIIYLSVILYIFIYNLHVAHQYHNSKAPKYFFSNRNANRQLQNTNSSGEYIVTWDVDLGGKDFLLESSFLKAGLERSVKEFINNDIMCDDELSDELGDSAFFSIEIKTKDELSKKGRVSGNGKCKGNRTRCKKN